MSSITQLTRRSLIAGAAMAPVVTTAGPAVAGDRVKWKAALSNYVQARRQHEQFLAEVLDPEVRRKRSGSQGLTIRIVALEEQGNDLWIARNDALQRLIAIPADDLEALLLKLRLAYEEVLRFEDGEGWIGAILADLDRLAD